MLPVLINCHTFFFRIWQLPVHAFSECHVLRHWQAPRLPYTSVAGVWQPGSLANGSWCAGTPLKYKLVLCQSSCVLLESSASPCLVSSSLHQHPNSSQVSTVALHGFTVQTVHDAKACIHVAGRCLSCSCVVSTCQQAMDLWPMSLRLGSCLCLGLVDPGADAQLSSRFRSMPCI